LKLEDFFIQAQDFDSATADAVCKYFQKATFQKESIILNEGGVANCIYFIEKGLAREFSYKTPDNDPKTFDTDEKESHWFLKENDWANQVESFTYGTPTKWGIEALEYTETRYVTKENFERMLTDFPFMALKAMEIFQHYLIEYENRFFFQKIKKVETRLEIFEEMFADILHKIPLNMIASYLNTTASNLSKVRRRRMQNKS
jgi:CRP/FNR family transcriptional regulator, anaerobic regulatory protein